jgi:hypothetical protein
MLGAQLLVSEFRVVSALVFTGATNDFSVADTFPSPKCLMTVPFPFDNTSARLPNRFYAQVTQLPSLRRS